jgi:DnaJ-domain-containing protein 1
MSAKVPGDVHRSHLDDPMPDIARLMLARAFAEVFQAENQPVPEPLAAILRQMESWEDQHERSAS